MTSLSKMVMHTLIGEKKVITCRKTSICKIIFSLWNNKTAVDSIIPKLSIRCRALPSSQGIAKSKEI